MIERFAGRLLPVCILLCALSLSSCDPLRKWAGRPTSSELQALALRRDSLEREKAAQAAAREDSLRDAREKAAARQKDSLQREEMFRGPHPRVMHRSSRFHGCKPSPGLFSLIAGTFKDPGNAARFCTRLKRKGFDQARTLTLGNGFTLVSVYEDDEAASWLHFYHLAKSSLPEDAWLLIDDMR